MMATPGSAAGDGFRRERGGEVQPFRAAAVEQDGEAEHQENGHFQAHQDRKDAGAQLDVHGPQDLDAGHGDQREQPPRNRNPGGCQQAGEGGPVQSVHCRLHRAVGQQRKPCRAGAGLASERCRDIGVKGAVGLHLPAHGHEADGEDHNDDADDEVGARGAGTVAERCCQGCGTDDSGQRRLRGQDKEEDAQHADAACAQGGGVFLAWTGFCGPGFGIRNTHWILLNGHECWGSVRGRRCPDICGLLRSVGLRMWAAP